MAKKPDGVSLLLPTATSKRLSLDAFMVQLNPHHPDWLGATTADNISAELSAMVAAQNLAMRGPATTNFVYALTSP